MSTPVTYVGTQYSVPAYQDTGYAQGPGNLSSYLIALATGGLTLSGGSFPLASEVDFGALFGLKAIYYKSRATVSTVGVFRLGNAESIGWRNALNTDDLLLTLDSSNRWTFNTTNLVIDTANGRVGIGGNPATIFNVQKSEDATTSFLLQNTSNTSGAAAQLLIRVAGAVAQDPITIYSVSGVTEWQVGVDNSDSDKFKINNATFGSSDKFSMDTSGNLTLIGTLQITGDITDTQSGKGLVVTTPNGLNTYRIAVDNDGSITTEQLS